MKPFFWVLIFLPVAWAPVRGQGGFQGDWHWGGSLTYHKPTGDLSDFKPGFDAALVLMRFRNDQPHLFFDLGTTSLRLDGPVAIGGANGMEGPVLRRDVRLAYLDFSATLFRLGSRFRVASGGGLARYGLGSEAGDASGASLLLETSYQLERNTALVFRFARFWEVNVPTSREGLSAGRWTLGLRWVPRAVKVF